MKHLIVAALLLSYAQTRGGAVRVKQNQNKADKGNSMGRRNWIMEIKTKDELYALESSYEFIQDIEESDWGFYTICAFTMKGKCYVVFYSDGSGWIEAARTVLPELFKRPIHLFGESSKFRATKDHGIKNAVYFESIDETLKALKE